MRKHIVKVVSILLLAGMSGCAGDMSKHVDHSITSAKQGTRISNVSKTSPTQVSHTSGIWVSANVIHKSNKDNDEWLDEPIVITEAKPLGLNQLISYMQSFKDGVTVTTTPDALIAMGGGISGSSSGGSTSSSSSSSTSSSSSSTSSGGFTLDIHGTYKNLFNSIASQGGVSWRATGRHHVEFFEYETRVFHLNALQTSATQTSDQKNDFSIKNSIKSDTWSELKTVLGTIKSSSGDISLSPSLGLVVVHDTPEIIGRIKKVIDDLNKGMTSQILIDVKLIKYDSNKAADVSADLVTAFKTANRQISVTGIGAAITGASTATASIINTNSKYNGSQVVLGALKSTGEISTVMQRALVGVNNTTIPFMSSSSKTYIKKIGGALISSTGPSTAPTVTPGTASTSINMMFYPRIVEKNKVLLQTDIKLSTIDRIRTITSGSGANKVTIGAPDLSKLFFNQVTMLKDGQTLVISGTSVENNNRGNVISILAGSHKKTNQTTRLVLIVTMHILNG